MALINYENEYGRLRKVALYRPALAEIEQEDASLAMYVDVPEARKVLVEFDAVVQKLRTLGVEVVVLEPHNDSPATSNMIYLRDVAFVFQDKLMLANMKYPLRQDEPQKFKELICDIDDSFAGSCLSLKGGVSMEGADLLAINKDLLYVYAGSRTDESVIPEIKGQFKDVEVKKIQANIDGVPQHILGGVHIIDDRLATRRVQYCTDDIEGYSFIDFDEDVETSRGFALNIVTIGPREVLMPANNPATKARLEAEGIICHEVDINEIHKMGGGLACMVLPLWRDI
jgi:N-dimethylarginine dimethylaminohydrolase